MEKLLTDKQLHSRLNKYYKKHFGELDTDEWYVNPANNVWKFMCACWDLIGLFVNKLDTLNLISELNLRTNTSIDITKNIVNKDNSPQN